MNDKDEIREVLEQFCFYFDGGYVDEWVNLFDSDGEMKAVGMPEPADPIRGHQALRAALMGAKKLPGKAKHLTTLGVIRIDGDSAWAKSSVLVTVCKAPAKISIALTGFYEDELIKLDGKWRFKRRVCQVESLGESLA